MPAASDIRATHWRKSTRSGTNNNCVEVAALPGSIGVRDSKDKGGPVLQFDAGDWCSFTSAAKGGQLSG